MGLAKLLFERFRLFADCLKLGVEEAGDQARRGGYDRIHFPR